MADYGSVGPLAGELALVTGAFGRLGRIWAQALRDAGAQVLLTDVTNAKNECQGMIGAAVEYLCYPGYNISEPDDVETLIKRISRECGRLPSILVNNAGVDSRPTDADAYDVVAEQMLRVNLYGTDLMTREFGQSMCHACHGSIINIASLYGLCAPDMRYYSHRPDGWVKDSMYGATKAGIISLTRYYAAKWGPHGVRVNALAPGGVVAEGDSLTAQDPQFVEKYTSRIPMGRMCRPEDLHGPLVFLASKASSFVTGQTIACDGGYLAW